MFLSGKHNGRRHGKRARTLDLAWHFDLLNTLYFPYPSFDFPGTQSLPLELSATGCWNFTYGLSAVP